MTHFSLHQKDYDLFDTAKLVATNIAKELEIKTNDAETQNKFNERILAYWRPKGVNVIVAIIAGDKFVAGIYFPLEDEDGNYRFAYRLKIAIDRGEISFSEIVYDEIDGEFVGAEPSDPETFIEYPELFDVDWQLTHN